MSISFKTDHQRLSSGAHKPEQDTVTPMICEKHSLFGSSGIDYVCNWCECSLLPLASGFYVHCPRCGKKIDYSNHEFLREGLNAIR